MSENIHILLHNVNSVNVVTQFANIILGFDIKNIIISKAEGSAAMSGVPTAQKMAFKSGKNLLYLADLADAVELIKPDALFEVVSKKYTDRCFNSREVDELINTKKKIMIAFNGQQTGFTKQEMDLGTPITLDLPADIGPLGSLAIILYEIHKMKR